MCLLMYLVFLFFPRDTCLSATVRCCANCYPCLPSAAFEFPSKLKTGSRSLVKEAAIGASKPAANMATHAGLCASTKYSTAAFLSTSASHQKKHVRVSARTRKECRSDTHTIASIIRYIHRRKLLGSLLPRHLHDERCILGSVSNLQKWVAPTG